MKAGQFRLRRRGQMWFASRSAPRGYLEFAGWLGQGILWVDGWLTSATNEPQTVTVVLDGVEQQLTAPSFRFPRSDLQGVPGAMGQISILQLGGLKAAPRRLQALYVRRRQDWYRWSSRGGLSIEPHLVQRLAEKATYFEPGVRSGLGDFWTHLRAVIPALDAAADPLYERNDSLARRLLAPTEESEAEKAPETEEEPGTEDRPEPEQQPLVSYSADPALPAGLCIDRVLEIAPQKLFLKGWIWDAEDVAEELTLELPSGRETALLGALARVERTDVAEMYRANFGGRADSPHGFVGLTDTEEPVSDLRRFRFELRLRDRQPLRVETLAWTADPFATREELLTALPEPDLGLVESHVHSALEPLQGRCRERIAVLRSFEAGEGPAAPEIALVVPLGEGIELMEHQLAQLADDPGLGRCELIYVLDSPRLEARFESAAFHLSRLYRVSIRGLVLSHAAGYAAAVNVGAEAARSRLLVLMHCDVFAAGVPWLETLAELHDSRQRPGPVGPKLLYEDGSIQHAGLGFSRDLEPDGLWTPRHLMKGLPGGHPQAGEARAVPAVSGACLMVERELFERAGGLRDAYAAGDYEDVDLCLRCLEQGCESRYLPAVELYHLEGQSRSRGPGWRRRNPWTRLYNRWLLTRLWGERLGELSERER